MKSRVYVCACTYVWVTGHHGVRRRCLIMRVSRRLQATEIEHRVWSPWRLRWWVALCYLHWIMRHTHGYYDMQA